MFLKKVQFFVLSVFVIFSSCLFADSVDKLIIITETYPPFNYEQEGSLKGIYVDIMELILKKNPGDFETVYPLSEGQLYFAFNKEISDAIISPMQGALDELKQGDAIKGIIQKYTR